LNITHNNYRFAGLIEEDEDGFFAVCPSLPGCYTQGETYEEALRNLRDAIQLAIEEMLQHGEEIPQYHQASLELLEFAY